MAYDENLADRIREILVDCPTVEEKKMMGGLAFMVDDKMCIGVMKDDLMCRIGPDREELALVKQGCRPMTFTGKAMKGYVFVDETGYTKQSDLRQWVEWCLQFNPLAKSSKKSKK